MKILFVHDWVVDPTQLVTWQDGLAGALRELGKRHVVDIVTYVEGASGEVYRNPEGLNIRAFTLIEDVVRYAAEGEYDVILMWGDCTRPTAWPIKKLGIPMALCFAGGHQFSDTTKAFDHFFVESKVYGDRFREMGHSVSTAFGTNTELFKPIPEQPKVFDVCFPATFALWKRHDLFAQAVRGKRAVACGYIYTTHERDCWQTCQTNGVLVLPHVSAQVLQRIYAGSRACLITSRSDGGSQRTVLEAMAMNLPVVVMQDSDKTSEYVLDHDGRWVSAPDEGHIKVALEEAMVSTVNSRDYIMSKWSEYCYADALEKGLCSLITT